MSIVAGMGRLSGELRGWTVASVLLATAMAPAQWAWFRIGPSPFASDEASVADAAYTALVLVAIVGWLGVLASGVATMLRGSVPPPPLPVVALTAGLVALSTASVLLLLSSGASFTDAASGDVFLQTWPSALLCLFAGEWVRRAIRRTP